MHLQKESSDTHVVIKAYSPGEVRLNIGKYTEVVFLVDGRKKDFEDANSFNQLTFEALEQHLKDKPEILIIGTGEKHQILPINIVKKINDLGIAVEAMASRQACHTYQVLMFEQRRIFALIYP
jgi:uncharacterized protein